MNKLPAIAIGGTRTGTIASLEDAPSTRGYGDEIKLGGNWEGEGVGVFYLPIDQANKFEAADLITAGRLVAGRPTYNLLAQIRIAVVRTSQSEYSVHAIDDAGNPIVVPAGAVRSRTCAPAPDDAFPATPTLVVPAGVIPPGSIEFEPPSAIVEASADDCTDPEALRTRWIELDEQYAAALGIAAFRILEIRETLSELFPHGAPEITLDDVVAGAGVLMQRAAGELLPYAGLVKGLNERLKQRKVSQ
jgi:hypothetical protein